MKVLAFDYCRSAWSFVFFTSSPQRPMTSEFEGFLSQILSITLLSYLNSSVRASISLFLMLSFKQGYHFYNVFGMTRSLTGDWTRDLPHSKPALYQHSTTRLLRRRLWRFYSQWFIQCCQDRNNGWLSASELIVDMLLIAFTYHWIVPVGNYIIHNWRENVFRPQSRFL